MKDIKKFLKNLDFLKVVIILLVIFTLIQIILSIAGLEIEDGKIVNRNDQSDTELDTGNVNIPETNPDDFPESRDLLSVLPYFSEKFTVNFLPLEPGVAPKIVVYYQEIDAEDDFELWLSQYTYSSDIQFIVEYDESVKSDYDSF